MKVLCISTSCEHIHPYPLKRKDFKENNNVLCIMSYDSFLTAEYGSFQITSMLHGQDHGKIGDLPKELLP